MTSLASVTLEVPDPAAAAAFYQAFGLDPYVTVRASDGTICKIATSKKKDTAPAARHVDQVALLLGVVDVKAGKRFYVDRGLAVAKSFGGKYVEFDAPSSAVTLALYPRRALAKDTGLPQEGTGSHRIVIGGDAGPFTDPDGFVWEAASV
ncbi:glyoxalase [Nonomuraea sp. NPDC050643]|uniref:glyoxalase n=1 Tax=Nonomuraea sp. NPDC050643 TaxID=3155660 RepID=UPI0033F554CD